MTNQESLPKTGDDAEDVARATRGDAAAFERLYRRHVPRINSLALRMVGPDRAAEVTQDTFVRAWQKLGSFRGEAQFVGSSRVDLQACKLEYSIVSPK